MSQLHSILISEIKRNIAKYNITYSRQRDFYIFFLNYENEIHKKIIKNKNGSFYLESKFYEIGDWYPRITYETQDKALVIFKIDFTSQFTMIMNRFK